METDMSRTYGDHDDAKAAGPELPMFPMSRKGDPETSKEAAYAVFKGLGRLQRRVWIIFKAQRAPMTAKEAEQLDCFAGLSPSTVRKRVSELEAAGLLEPTGEKRDRCRVLRVVE